MYSEKDYNDSIDYETKRKLPIVMYVTEDEMDAVLMKILKTNQVVPLEMFQISNIAKAFLMRICNVNGIYVRIVDQK